MWADPDPDPNLFLWQCEHHKHVTTKQHDKKKQSNKQTSLTTQMFVTVSLIWLGIDLNYRTRNKIVKYINFFYNYLILLQSNMHLDFAKTKIKNADSWYRSVDMIWCAAQSWNQRPRFRPWLSCTHDCLSLLSPIIDPHRSRYITLPEPSEDNATHI